MANQSGPIAVVKPGAATGSGLTVSASDRVLGRSTAGAGAIEEIACTAAARALLDDADAAAQRTTMGAAPAALVEEICLYVATPSDSPIVLIQSAEVACTIDRITLRTSAGTLTLAVQIDGVDVTDMDAIAVTDSEQTVAAGGANAVAVGATVTAVVSATSSAADLAATIKTTRT